MLHGLLAFVACAGPIAALVGGGVVATNSARRESIRREQTKK